MVPFVERELKKIPISLRERVSKTEMYIVLYVDMSTEEAIDVIGGIVIKSEHDLHRLRSSVLREGRSVLHLMPEEEVSSSLLNLTTTVVPVILMEEDLHLISHVGHLTTSFLEPIRGKSGSIYLS